ncbi:hypothetical protein N7493_011976 [Penicillium malachiteum]|uniref:Uncharacterized protein n=1 Tax=Penicillium malachiteum TaxID=1324776 RepID=A0AAD6MPU5_9EURO|nr:hypothetical protein N7493_011976 [Penicillium malachiteum]
MSVFIIDQFMTHLATLTNLGSCIDEWKTLPAIHADGGENLQFLGICHVGSVSNMPHAPVQAVLEISAVSVSKIDQFTVLMLFLSSELPVPIAQSLDWAFTPTEC